MRPPKPELMEESDYNPHEEGVVVWMRDTTGPVRFTRGWVWFVEANGSLCLRGASNLESGRGEIIFPADLWTAVATDHGGKTMVQARSPSLYGEAIDYAVRRLRASGDQAAVETLGHVLEWAAGRERIAEEFWDAYHAEIRTKPAIGDPCTVTTGS